MIHNCYLAFELSVKPKDRYVKHSVSPLHFFLISFDDCSLLQPVSTLASIVCLFLNLMVQCVKKKDFFLKLPIDHFIRTRQVFWNILYILCFYIDKTILISLNCLLSSSNILKNTCLNTGTWMLLEFCLHYPSGVPRTNNDSQTCYNTLYYK